MKPSMFMGMKTIRHTANCQLGPLLAISGLFATPRIMSALPPKADLLGRHEKGLLMTQSGHWLSIFRKYL